MQPERVAAFRGWLVGLVDARSSRGQARFELAVELFARLDDPQNSAPAVHIVGTAGKGSVAGLLTDRLVGAGLRVATHQSPHVHDVRERFLLQGRLPEWAAVLAAAEPVVEAVAAVERDFGRTPSFFAATAALAWELGRRHDVELFVIEAGIGGRLDATNVIRRSDVLTVVTAIGLDHVEVLGTTVQSIATEKAAVLEGRNDVVIGPQPHPEADEAVRRVAAEVDCAVHAVDGVFADWKQEAEATVDVVAEMLARHLGRRFPPVAVRFPPGRFETLDVGERRLILDGAHNPMKLGALRRYLGADQPACGVVAVGRNKDLRQCATALAELSPLLIVTEFGAGGAGPRSWPAPELAAVLHDLGSSAEVAITPEAAAAAALGATNKGDTLLVTGSFLHLSDVRDQFVRLG